ncbi:unnamed protein product [Rodentolepis nana]|uniref:Helicase ATP-binding domain-containing protein n=1 Tax=Rodentolepis nana TaxID=102285 RepID=A0A0R3TX78_RODNA|nr:unnamed protein product [Rodentolepis nana]
MTGRLMGAIPQIPPAPITSHQDQSNFKLPVREEQSHLITLINENQIVVIAGHQGSGKSTQIPQIILEDHYARSQRCRVICTQPRRLLAHANADRVAHERGETVGQSVGYQIRLESKASPKTVLTFCTHGVLLRTIFADPSLLNAVTHIIVDELEETDLFTRKLADNGREIQLPMSIDTNKHTCNLLLGILQRILPQYSHLKLVLVVNLNADSVISPNVPFTSTPTNHEISSENSKYMHVKEPILQTGLPLFPEESSNFPSYAEKFLITPQYQSAVIYSLKTERKSQEIYFLEDILRWLDFYTPGMESLKQVIQNDTLWVQKMFYWLTGTQIPRHDVHDDSVFENNDQTEYRDILNSSNFRNIDKLIWALWENLVLRNISVCSNQQDSVLQKNIQPLISDLLQSISVEWIPVDYRHSETGITPLMLFSAAGQHEVVERLLNMGADVFERIPLPLAALPPSLVTLGTDQAAPTYNTPNHISVIGANAYDLARLYGHAHMAEILKLHMAARSIDNPVDDWESNLLRFGCWFANPILQTPSLLHSPRNSELAQSYKIWGNFDYNEANNHRLYQVARNLSGSESAIDFDLLTQLILKIDSTLQPGGILVFMPSYEAIITLKELLTTSTRDSLRAQISEKPKCFHLFSKLRMASLENVENPYHQTSCCSMEEVYLQAKLLCAPGENLRTCFSSLPRLPDPRGLEWSIRYLHVKNSSNV